MRSLAWPDAGATGARDAQRRERAVTVEPRPLSVGDTPPDFVLRDGAREEHALSQFREHKHVVVAFYVLAFTGG